MTLEANHKWCPDCGGDGVVWTDTPCHSGWSEHKAACDECGGSGQVELDSGDFDGSFVRVVSSGFVGVASIYHDSIIVMDDQEQEVFVSGINDLELLTTT